MPRLALSRRVGERVHLLLNDGRKLILSIVEIDRQRKSVRMLIEAPADVIISREELLVNYEPPLDDGEWGEI